MFGNIGGSELFLILLVILVFFGAKKLPEGGLKVSVTLLQQASVAVTR